MNTRRRLTGVVTSNKMEKTVLVEISRTYRHRLYKKVVSSKKRVMAHDELECEIGDHVQIVESHPISRHKHWVVQEILRRDVGAGETDLMIDEPEFTLAEPETIEDEAVSAVDEPVEMVDEPEDMEDEAKATAGELEEAVEETGDAEEVDDEPDSEGDA